MSCVCVSVRASVCVYLRAHTILRMWACVNGCREETEIDKMIIGLFYAEETGRALKYPHLNLANVSMSKQPLHWKNLILLLQMLESSFQQEGQDVFYSFPDDLTGAAQDYSTTFFFFSSFFKSPLYQTQDKIIQQKWQSIQNTRVKVKTFEFQLL